MRLKTSELRHWRRDTCPRREESPHAKPSTANLSDLRQPLKSNQSFIDIKVALFCVKLSPPRDIYSSTHLPSTAEQHYSVLTRCWGQSTAWPAPAHLQGEEQIQLQLLLLPLQMAAACLLVYQRRQSARWQQQRATLKTCTGCSTKTSRRDMQGERGGEDPYIKETSSDPAVDTVILEAEEVQQPSAGQHGQRQILACSVACRL